MEQKLIPLPATLLLPKSLEGSPKEGPLPEGQFWHTWKAELSFFILLENG